MSLLVAGTLARDGQLRPGWVDVRGETILDADWGRPARTPDETWDGVIAPGLVDLQVNGAAGHEVSGGQAALDAIDAVQLSHGVTRYLAAIVDPGGARAEAAVAAISERIADPSSPVAGVHLEGPFLSPEHTGMHRPETLHTPSEGVPDCYWAPVVRLVTLAPELPGALDLIERLRADGTGVALGHSGASAALARAGIDAGASMITHVFNAMAPFHHREPGLPGVALVDGRVSVGVIADGHHIDPIGLEIVRRCAGPRTVLVSDASPAAAAEPGRYELGGVSITKDADGAVRTDSGQLAGSALTPRRGGSELGLADRGDGGRRALRRLGGSRSRARINSRTGPGPTRRPRAPRRRGSCSTGDAPRAMAGLIGTRLLRLGLIGLAGALALLPAGCGGAGPPGPPPVRVAPDQLIVSPARNTPDASPTTQISFLGAPISSLGHISVVGSRTGRHLGRLALYASVPGGSFLPDRPFASGEQVHLRVDPRPGGLTGPFELTFQIAQPAPPPPRPGGGPVPPHLPQLSFHSAPDLHPPPVTVSVDHRTGASGEFLLAPLTNRPGGGHLPQRGLMMLDSHGRMVWFLPTAGQLAAENLSVQHYEGTRALTWWQGVINPLGFGTGVDVIVDSSYHEIARITGGNGYSPDLHEFLLTPQDTAWYTVYAPVRADLRRIHGRQDGSLLDSIIQELDIKTGLVMYEWHSFGHIAVPDSHAKLMSDPRFAYDFSHLNTIEPHHDTLILSARNTWAVYEINMHTGEMNWQLGGNHSTFHLGSGVRFAWQHDAQLHPDGTLSVFDNEAAPVIEPLSRALLIKLDPAHHTATLLRHYTHPAQLIAGTQGSVQLLRGGNMVVGWGSDPYFSEIDAGGKFTFDAHFSRPIQSYRAYDLPWNGAPTALPAIAAKAVRPGEVEVYASWNGATQVARWQVMAGSSPSSLAAAGAADWSGFETRIPIRSGQHFVAVQALDSAHRVLATSPTVHI